MPHGDSTHSQSTQEQSTQGESVQATGTTPLRGGRARALPALLAAAPWWVVLAAGLVCVWLGFGLAVKPLSSLAALTFYVGASFIASGIVDLIDRERAAAPATRMVLGWGWIASGIVVLAWSGATMALLPLMVAISLIVSGLVRGIDSFRGTGTPADGRMATLVFALADLILGVVSLAWPDVTLLLLAFLFGVRTVIFGLGSIWSALVQARSGSPTAVRRRPTVLRHWTRLAGAVLSLVLAVAAAGIGVQLRDGAPQLSDFYTAPETLPAHAGALLKSEPFTTAVPAGTKAWRILYTTTRADSTPTVASAVVLTSLTPATGPRPVITWAHGTTGYAPACAPSNLAEPFTSGALPALDEIVDNGWVLVTTDYTGMGTQGPQPYLIGQGEARSVLDSVRAAKALDAEQAELDMAEGTVVWGHSQGGQAELWTGGIAASYAPDVKISGVVAMAPASDAIGLVENLPAIAGGSIFASYVAAAYAAMYPDVSFNDYIAPTARTFVREMSTRCLTEPGVLVSLISAIAIDKNKTIFSKDPTQGALGERLRENTPVLPIPFALFIAQEESDTLVIPPVQDAYVAARCADGQELEYRKYADKDHIGLVSEGSPLLGDLIAWTKDRIAGKPAADTCNDLN